MRDILDKESCIDQINDEQSDTSEGEWHHHCVEAAVPLPVRHVGDGQTEPQHV